MKKDNEEEDTSADKAEEPKQAESNNRELYIVLAVMGCLLAVFLVAFTIFHSLQNFEYQGLNFKKTKLGDIPMYQYYYYTSLTGNIASDPKLINLYLRLDPRQNDVPVDGEIELIKGKTVYISIDSSGLAECEDNSIALANLGSFLNANGFGVKGAVPNEAEANSTGLMYVNCSTKPDNPVLLIKSGEETEIEREKTGTKYIVNPPVGAAYEEIERTNCYIITVAKCEILEATEKFTLQSIIDARANNPVV